MVGAAKCRIRPEEIRVVIIAQIRRAKDSHIQPIDGETFFALRRLIFQLTHPTGENSDNRIIMKTKTSAFTLIEIMIVVAIIGLLASIAIPSISGAIEKSRKQACAINRKNIDGAKAAWALENQKPHEAVPTEEELFGDTTYIDHRPDCPAGGKYSLNAVREKCACSVVPHAN